MSNKNIQIKYGNDNVFPMSNETELFTVTISNSVTDLTTRTNLGVYNKTTKLVILDLVLYSPAGLFPMTNKLFGSVPEKYKPKYGVSTIGIVVPLSSSNFNPSIEAFRIDTNGNMYFGNFVYGEMPTKLVSIHLSYYTN